MEKVFVDASCNPVTRYAVGCYLYNGIMKFHYMNNKTSTQAEIETVLAMMNVMPYNKIITIYTDCMAVIKMYNNRHVNQSQNELCRLMHTHTNITFQKIKGHKPSVNRDENDKLFAHVDKTARKALRNNIWTV